MPKDKISIGLEVGFNPNLEDAIYNANKEGYEFVCMPMKQCEKSKTFFGADMGGKLGDGTNTEFVLDSHSWSRFVVAKLSQWNTNTAVTDMEKAVEENLLNEELSYAAYLGLPAVLVPISGANSSAVAKVIYGNLLTCHHGMSMWIQVKMSSAEEGSKSKTSWDVWNSFRLLCNMHNRVGVALEVGADLPDPVEIEQWLGEPVKILNLPKSIFLTNKKGFPVLSKAHQKLLLDFFKLRLQIIVSGESQHEQRTYEQYISYLYQHRPMPDQYEAFATGYEDYLQAPLQPLMDNLESGTYEIFEKDPVKYREYENAVYKCLCDKSKNSDSEIVVMVLGAGRGPLVRAAFRASDRSDVKIKCYAVEKNKNAVCTLQLLKKTEFKDRNFTLVSCDMREWQAPELADVIVSELLGSFGDNELSPECLDGADRFLKPDAVSIPCEYTSYMSPISSQKLYNEVSLASNIDREKPRYAAFETPYVVRIHNYNELDKAKPVFTFTHPTKQMNGHQTGDKVQNSDSYKNYRHGELSFDIGCNTLLHGFAGYFHCVLYDDVTISIVPETHSPGMFSWFPIFFPIIKPISVSGGSTVSVNLWRCCSSQKVWYEWAVTDPVSSAIHNPGGRSYTIGL